MVQENKHWTVARDCEDTPDVLQSGQDKLGLALKGAAKLHVYWSEKWKRGSRIVGCGTPSKDLKASFCFGLDNIKYPRSQLQIMQTR